MLGSKAPNNDANGLFRATHSHNPTRYSHIMVLTPHFYAHIGAGQKVILPPVCKHTWFQTFCPWHHTNILRKVQKRRQNEEKSRENVRKKAGK